MKENTQLGLVVECSWLTWCELGFMIELQCAPRSTSKDSLQVCCSQSNFTFILCNGGDINVVHINTTAPLGFGCCSQLDPALGG